MSKRIENFIYKLTGLFVGIADAFLLWWFYNSYILRFINGVYAISDIAEFCKYFFLITPITFVISCIVLLVAAVIGLISFNLLIIEEKK
jgi:uncharacterized membrane protein